MIGGGFLKLMNDTLRYNRDILGKRKSARELYKDEIRKKGSRYEHQDLVTIRQRVEERIKRNKIHDRIVRTSAVVALLGMGIGAVWIVTTIDFVETRKGKYENKASLFNSIIYKQSDDVDLHIDYFVQGPRASETYFKNGKKHQNSESYYETGEQFRSALYYYNTLVKEVYFFKNGDSIRNFPIIHDKEVHSITAINESALKRIEFDFYDGKIIQGTYAEYDVK